MELVHYFDALHGEVNLREANNLPFICWPDRSPCLAANAFMVQLYKRNLSRNNNGGTLRQFAKDISHLIRYCSDNCIDFIQMNGDRFTDFIAKLRSEKDPLNLMARKRDSNTLIAIGRKCIEFLDFIGKLNGDDGFVIYTLKAQQKKYQIRTKNSKSGRIEKFGWHHESFDTPGPRKNRLPISRQSIKELYDAIPLLSSTNLDQQSKRFIDRRRTVMLRLLEMTGARIEEVARIQVKDIEEAVEQNNPMLRLTTLKKRRSEHRFVPVLHQDLAALKAYVRVNRNMVIKRTIRAAQDHGSLFVSEITGKPITSKYMSNEIGLLRRTAGIGSQACAHMFRNRFITKLFVRLINQYDFDNKDNFRKALLDANTLKQQVQQYTGHGNVASLDTYIDMAFDEVANLVAVVSTVQLQEAFDSFDSNVDILQMELKAGLPITIYLEKYHELLNLRTTDVAHINELQRHNNSE
ncbi:integrase [Methyloradius palustris]|uniref:Integrase n=2 Tax=Methyloradius palustris TaxID=2778876 RepID=A0A8D5G049_9PROT|nr:integrase [Methyloradius palustris]